MKIMISGLVNVETTLKIKEFPITYYPIEYSFFGIKSNIGGVAYNIAKAFKCLGNDTEFISFLGPDAEGERIRAQLEVDCIGAENIIHGLKETPVSLILYDDDGRRQIYCDLKDVQEQSMDITGLDEQIKECDIVVACNANFNRPLLRRAKELGKLIATDVHVLSDIEDTYNKEFMQYADILFLSDELIPTEPERFLMELKTRYKCKIIVIGRGSKGAMMYDRMEDRVYSLAAAEAENVVNTIGAGDALFTSFLNYYGKGYSVLEALKRAEIFAAIKIGYNGASVGFSDEETIEKAYDMMAGRKWFAD